MPASSRATRYVSRSNNQAGGAMHEQTMTILQSNWTQEHPPPPQQLERQHCQPCKDVCCGVGRTVEGALPVAKAGLAMWALSVFTADAVRVFLAFQVWDTSRATVSSMDTTVEMFWPADQNLSESCTKRKVCRHPRGLDRPAGTVLCEARVRLQWHGSYGSAVRLGLMASSL